MMMVKLNWMTNIPGSDDELGFKEIEVAQYEDEDEDTKYETEYVILFSTHFDYLCLVTVKEIA